MTLLNLVFALPVVGFFLLLFVPRDKPQVIRGLAIAMALITLVASIGLAIGFGGGGSGMQFATDVIWIPSPEIHFHVGIDGLSLWLVILTTLLTPICILVSWRSIDKRVKEFFAFLLLLEFGLIGVFISQDLLLFYVFWEV
jgi:NADH-quinone oxidoreductase subunit M